MIDWISVKDRFPEENKKILILLDNKFPDVGDFKNGIWDIWCIDISRSGYQKRVTHWAEINLPKRKG